MNYSEPCQYSTRLVEKLELLDTETTLDFDLIHKAIYWAKKYHDGQFRKSGEPFYTHPLEVAYMLSEYKLKTDVILHDIVEDTQVTAGMILDSFGRRIEEMVDRLTRDRPDGSKLSVEEILNNAYEKNDKEVLLVKLIDRLHNLSTVKSFNKTKQIKIKTQTLEDFLPLLLETEDYKAFQIITSLCIEDKNHPVFHELLGIRLTPLNQQIYNIKNLQCYDY
jgi:guanosine-3',5'-bis(diphosphate) 3'-pyrophosphohydrolase